MQFLKRFLRALPLLILSPVLVPLSLLALALTDLAWKLFGGRKAPASEPARHDSATVVIPNWNGRDLLEKYLPSIVQALSGNPANEIIVVDNGSDDGSADFVRHAFPGVKVLALARESGLRRRLQRGLSRGAQTTSSCCSTATCAWPRIFWRRCSQVLTDPDVFAVSCQIFFSDPGQASRRNRADAGLVAGRRAARAASNGRGGDGPVSVLLRRRRLVRVRPAEVSGTGRLRRAAGTVLPGRHRPGLLAWKRGWKVLYQPRSVVYHEHRGTIGKRFTKYIQSVLKKNFLLFCWKNIHDWPRLRLAFLLHLGGRGAGGDLRRCPAAAELRVLWKRFRQLPRAVRSRWRARTLARGRRYRSVSPAAGRILPGPLRGHGDRNLNGCGVLFVSPYPICPPVHGGGVFMYQTLRELSRLAEVHVVELLDWPEQERPPTRNCANSALRRNGWCGPAERRRGAGSMQPHAVREFGNGDLEWLIHRQMYSARHRRAATRIHAHGAIPWRVPAHPLHPVRARCLFPVDRAGPGPTWRAQWTNLKARVEYLRALRYELRVLPASTGCRCAARQPRLPAVLSPRTRAAAGGRSARRNRHARLRVPRCGQRAVHHAVRGQLPARPEPRGHGLVRARSDAADSGAEPRARLVVAGSDPPPVHAYSRFWRSASRCSDTWTTCARPLVRYAVFVCPILSGSGVRVKLLEAFAAGIPVVSTRVGAEGLANQDGEICRAGR